MRHLSNYIPPPLCGHTEPLRVARGYKAQCPICCSFWDLDALDAGLHYDADYPAARSHYDEKIGENKVATLQAWLACLSIDLMPLTVCEVGFGGGFCLKFLNDNSSTAFGIEAIDENVAHAVSLGIEENVLFLAQALPAKLPQKVDLWIFSDSFEHLPDPDAFVSWIYENSTRQAQMLIVTPESGSLSEKVFGRLWPHKMNDHRFHWSKQGLVQFLNFKQFSLAASFNPTKYVSLLTITSHLLQKLRAPMGIARWIIHLCPSKLRLHFNIGEMGIIFRKRDGHQ